MSPTSDAKHQAGTRYSVWCPIFFGAHKYLPWDPLPEVVSRDDQASTNEVLRVALCIFLPVLGSSHWFWLSSSVFTMTLLRISGATMM